MNLENSFTNHKIYNTLLKHTNAYRQHCRLDLSSIQFLDKKNTKALKAALPQWIQKHQSFDLLTLKVSTSFASIIKYALNAGFKFEEANSETAVLIHQPKSSLLFNR